MYKGQEMANIYEDEKQIVASIDFNEIVPPELLRELQKTMSNVEIIKYVEEEIKKRLQEYTTGKVTVVKAGKIGNS